MRFFFRSRQFKIILSITLALVIISGIFAAVGGLFSPQSNIISVLTAPFRSFASWASSSISNISSAFTEGNALMLENAQLEAEINQLQKELAEYQKAISENEFYKDYLDIKDANPDFKFAPATLISRDNDDPYKGFVINKGSLDSVEKYDPVITDAGLVGYVSQVGLTTSKVTTLLSPDLTVGALGNRTSDSGIVSGGIEFAEKKQTRFYNLSRSCSIAIGDYVVTSGEGIFPQGLLIGKIASIGNDKYNTSLYASVELFADLDELRDVMVITEFDGQGTVLNQGEN